jgi:hypothetical protein
MSGKYARPTPAKNINDYDPLFFEREVINMAKKKVALPKNFGELIKTGDIAALKAVFDTCDVNARGGFGKGTALHFYGIPGELVSWLAENGADVNATDIYGKTPLYAQATIGSSIVELLIELGADVNKPTNDNDTPLHAATGGFHAKAVQTLLTHGAAIHSENNIWKRTPLESALASCSNIQISRAAEISKIMLNAGEKITLKMRESIERIGKTFEFHREGFNKDYLAETEAGLAKLYEIFGVEPIAGRRVHDGVSPITVTSVQWQDRHSELWNYLVPSSGHAQTVQGEVIRITGRISHEILDNGGVNWDAEYRRMASSLLSYFVLGNSLPANELTEAEKSVASISPKGNADDEPARLAESAVKWVLLNPQPIALTKPNYKR